MQNLVFGDLTLDETCLFAHRNGEVIQFTRNERALLLIFSRNRHRLMTRSRLLDAIATVSGTASDRNIDFLVNRLRAKLGDNARSPRYIATQYGEGYVWVAEPSTAPVAMPEPLSGDVWLVITPVVAVQRCGLRTLASSLIDQLRAMIATQVGAGRQIVVDDKQNISTASRSRHVLQVSFHADESRFHGTATLRDMPSRHIVKAFRLDLQDTEAVEREAARLSQAVVAALGQVLADAPTGLGTSTEAPLEIRLRQASVLLSSSNPQWLERGHQLSAARKADPASADIAMQWCLHLFARLVLANPFDCVSMDDRDIIESEIEAIVLDCLPAVEANPLLMLAAAKMLYFINRGHLDLAEDLAERAFTKAADFAAALPLLAQVKQAKGQFSVAVALFDRAIEAAAADSAFILYLQVLKCVALLAAGDHAGLDAAATFTRDTPECPPDLMALIELTFARASQPLPVALANTLALAGPDGARSALMMLYCTSARQHVSAADRTNIMRGLLHHVTSLYGAQVVPAFIRVGIGDAPTDAGAVAIDAS